MAWYDDVLKTIQQPFEGVGDAFSEMNLLGASVPESFKMMKDSGLLGEKEYQSAVDKANSRGTRNALLKGLIAYGTQDFNKGYGSALDARYLRTPALVGMNESQKALDQLPTDVATKYQMAGLKRTADDAATRAAYVKELKSGKYGEFTDAELDLAGSMTIPQLVDMKKGKNPQFKTLIDDQGLSQDYIVKGPDVTNWIPVGSKRQEDSTVMKDPGKASSEQAFLQIKNGSLGFEPTNPQLLAIAANNVASVAKLIQQQYLDAGQDVSLAQVQNEAIQLLKESEAYKEAPAFYKGGSEQYDSEKFINYANKKYNASIQNNKSSGEVIQLSNGNIFKTGVGELKLLPDGTYQKVK